MIQNPVQNDEQCTAEKPLDHGIYFTKCRTTEHQLFIHTVSVTASVCRHPSYFANNVGLSMVLTYQCRAR